MERFSNERKERFCQLYALSGKQPSECAFEAGYGRNQYSQKCSYHNLISSRLLQREDVNLRIETIRRENREEDNDYTKKLLTDLKKILDFDYSKYFASANVTLKNGRVLTDWYLKVPLDKWTPDDRKLMLNGFNSQGRPIFMNKEVILDKLLKIYNLDGKTSIDMEDMLSLFTYAGLPIMPNQEVAEAMEKSIQEDLED
jgi:hypothetical protein